MFKKLWVLLLAVPLSLMVAHTAYAGSYTVMANDSLYKIGRLFNTTASSIAKANNLSGETIYPGQVLNVPCSTYSVKSGDSLYLISNRHNVTLDSLRKANNKWDNNIYPGQILNIPGTAASGTQTATSSVPASSTSKAVIPYTQAELDLLSRLITAEADGESYVAKVAVGAVVVNRVQDSRFPNSISAVIYQKDGGYYQFSPVENGWINKPASSDSKRAALEALQGSDPTNGALYYFDDSTTNKWIWSKPIAFRTGNMVYSYY
jgi:spore germination cell wall hydrolase CwlJ-like protein